MHDPRADVNQQTQRPCPDPDPIAEATPGHSPTAAPVESVLRTRHWLVLTTGLAAGFAGDRALTVNVATPAPYLVAAALSLLVVTRHRAGHVPTQHGVLLVASVLLALVTVVRDTEILVVLATFASLALLALAATPQSAPHTFRLVDTTVVQLVGAWCRSAIVAAFGPVRAGGTAVSLAPTGSPFAAGLSIARAVLLSTAVVVTIGVLLAAGDPVFAAHTAALRHVRLSELFLHGVMSVVLAWPVIGLLMSAGALSDIHVPAPALSLPRLNRLDVITVLGALTVLFLAFVLLQLRVLFGGADYVATATGLSLAEYARHGFFTLVLVAAATIGLLLLLDARFGRDSLAGWTPARRLSQTLVVLVGVVMASAASRMWLYVVTFGLSLDRILALAIIAWLACVCAWLYLTVLAARGRQFVVGALAAGCLCFGALASADPDRLVVQDMISRAQRGLRVDVSYVVQQLSADAVPPLVDAIATGVLTPSAVAAVPPASRSTAAIVAGRPAPCLPVEPLLTRWAPIDHLELNLSRRRARAAVARHRVTLRAMAC